MVTCTHNKVVPQLYTIFELEFQQVAPFCGSVAKIASDVSAGVFAGGFLAGFGANGKKKRGREHEFASSQEWDPGFGGKTSNGKRQLQFR